MQSRTFCKASTRGAELGVDIIIAQGSEAGGFCSDVSSLALIPQVVDVVNDWQIPVVGRRDCRWTGVGMEALMLGAQGINIGTRFLASVEASMVNEQWKQRIISAESEDTVRVNFINDVFPVSNPASYKGTAPRALRTSFIEEWSQKSADEVKKQAEQLRNTMMTGIKEGKNHELVPFTGQSTGLFMKYYLSQNNTQYCERG